jgi:Holliday junction resolvasome RuvABC endonuclease subunit
MKPLPDLYEIERKVKRAAKKKAVRAPLSINLFPGASVVGIDLSLVSTGFAVWSHGSTTQRAIGSRYKGLLRIDDIACQVLDACQAAKAALVVIEAIAYGRSDSMHAEICGAWYTAALALVGAGFPLIAVTAPSLKKFVCGTGSAKKEDMRLGAYKRWGVECRTNDEVDALGLAHFGAMLGGLEAPNVAQSECLAKAWRVE